MWLKSAGRRPGSQPLSLGCADILDLAARKGEDLFILLLDLIQNPQNLGTLLRTAEAAGVHGVVIPTHRAAEVTPAVVNASAGASEHLLIAQGNLVQVWNELKKEHTAWIIGLEGGPQGRPVHEIPRWTYRRDCWQRRGGHARAGQGTCDFMLSLPMARRDRVAQRGRGGSIVLYQVLLPDR
jgi:23S rRNA (guanosine2251-2'-O)-methyltransferase